MESKRDEQKASLDLSAVSMDTLFTDDGGSLHDISIVKELENMETSFDGTFDGEKVPSKFEFDCKNDSWLDNARQRCDKRFERGLGVNLIKSDELELKPVRNSDKSEVLEKEKRISIRFLASSKNNISFQFTNGELERSDNEILKIFSGMVTNCKQQFL